jgi:hypothetical protein
MPGPTGKTHGRQSVRFAFGSDGLDGKRGPSAPAAIEPPPVVIEITGGDKVEFSNITVTFLLPGSNHFGASPLPGVVHSVEER